MISKVNKMHKNDVDMGINIIKKDTKMMWKA